MIEVVTRKSTKTAVICPFVSGVIGSISPESCLEETCGLAAAINLDVCHKEILHIKSIRPSLYFSRGVTDKLAEIIETLAIELLVVNCRLSPIQQRNLERLLQIKVIDRTALILEIFGERAKTKEGSLQVELAHLMYQRSRLVRSWTHLERQRGGAGFLGGPGETQIELDRRIIDDKIIKIKKDLDKVRRTRDIQRGARRKVPYPVIALVGYTNAGKSTLFNYLTQSQVLAQDMLFATLDPTMRKLKLPDGPEVIFSDTVGFISDLPHELVMAFRATLEEVLAADVVLHVCDIANPNTAAQREDVLQVLEKIGLKDIQHADNYIEVLNKIDLLSPQSYAQWQNKTRGKSGQVMVSALSGEGCGQLLQQIKQILTLCDVQCIVSTGVSAGKTMAWLYQNSQVNSLETGEKRNTYVISISQQNFSRLCRMAELDRDIVVKVKK